MTYAPLFLWVGVIFLLSSGQGSMDETSRIIGPILKFLFPAASDETLHLYHFYIRKLAHLTEYAILGFFAVRTFAGTAFFQKYRTILGLAVVLAIALIDEVNQSFEPTRTGAFGDVMLDLAGGGLMILVLFLLRRPRPLGLPAGQP